MLSAPQVPSVRNILFTALGSEASGADWKPLHHDTAAFSQRRLGKQNITVGVSLGGLRTGERWTWECAGVMVSLPEIMVFTQVP